MKKLLPYLLLFLLPFQHTTAQIDSWRQEVELNKDDTSVIRTFASLSDYYEIRDFDSSEYFASQYLALAEHHGLIYWKAQAWARLARIAHLRGNNYHLASNRYDTAFSFIASLPSSSQKNDLYSSYYLGKGAAYHRIEVPDSALSYYNKFENHLIASGKKDELWNALRSKANLYYTLGDYKKSLKYSEDAYNNAVENNASRSQLGYILFFAIQASLNADDADAYNRHTERLIAFYGLDEKPYQLADSSAQHMSLLFLVSDINLIPVVRRAMDSSIAQGDYLRAAVHGKNLSEAYKKEEQWLNAMNALSVSSRMFRRLGMPSLLRKNHLEMVDFAKRLNQPERAVFHLEAAAYLQDSLQNAEHLERITELEVKHETEKKEREIVDKTYQRNLWIGLFGLLVLATAVVIYLLNNRLKLAAKLAYQERSEAARKLELSRYQSMVQAQEAERKRIARELHDGVGGSLASAQNYLSMLREQPEKADEFAKKSKQLIEDSSADIRRISHDLIPLSLKRLGLRAALSDLCSQLSEQHIPCDFEFSGDEKRLTDEQKLLLYRIVQESSNNVRKHAEANKALIQVIIGEDFLDLLVEDDGKGFERDSSSPSGHGLDSLFTRAAMLGGKLQVDSVKGEGTSVSVAVKL